MQRRQPDGTFAAYTSDEGVDRDVYVRTFPRAGAPTRVSEGGGQYPAWSPDGSTLYFFWANSAQSRILAARLRLDPVPTVLSTDTVLSPGRLSTAPDLGTAMHPDGDRFIFSRNAGGEGGPGVSGSPPVRVHVVANWFTELRQRMGDR